MRLWGSFRRAGLALGLLLMWLGCGEEPPPAAPVVRPVKILELVDGLQGRIREFPGEKHANLARESDALGPLLGLHVGELDLESVDDCVTDV